jgi:hypothetical protein
MVATSGKNADRILRIKKKMEKPNIMRTIETGKETKAMAKHAMKIDALNEADKNPQGNGPGAAVRADQEAPAVAQAVIMNIIASITKTMQTKQKQCQVQKY